MPPKTETRPAWAIDDVKKTKSQEEASENTGDCEENTKSQEEASENTSDCEEKTKSQEETK